MATVKITSLVIRTLAKPISSKLKQQAQEHDRFRRLCIGIAQQMHRWEFGMRTNLLGETTGQKPHIRALSETKAIATGANFISEAFLFSVAVALILGEGVRSARKEGKRRDMVHDRLDALEEAVKDVLNQQSKILQQSQTSDERNSNILKLLEGVIDVEMRNAEMRRILSHDPDVMKALANLEADQQKAGIDEKHRKVFTSKLEQQPTERLLDREIDMDNSRVSNGTQA